MLFKHARIYRISKPVDRSALLLKLTEKMERECQAHETSVNGWAAPVPDMGAPVMLHRQTDNDALRLVNWSRILPASVVNSKTDERVRKLEYAESRIIRRRERLEIKDEVLEELIPKALQKRRDTHAYIDYAAQWLIVDAASAGEAEQLIKTLRETLGTLPFFPLETLLAPSAVMRHWMQDKGTPAAIAIGTDAMLAIPTDNGIERITLRNHDMDSKEVETHLEAGKEVERLRITWDDKIEATICHDLAIKSINFSEIIADQIAETDCETKVQRFDTEQAIMVGTLREFIDQMIACFGGYPPDEQQEPKQISQETARATGSANQ